MRFTLIAALAALVAGPVLADQTTGTVHSWTPATHTLVLTDKTVWTLPADLVVPVDLVTGDRIDIAFQWKGDDGLGAIQSVARVAPADAAVKRSGI